MSGDLGLAPDWLEFEKELGYRPSVRGDLKSLLGGFDHFKEVLLSKLTFPPPDLSINTEDKEIAQGIKIRIYTPPKLDTPGIVAIYAHSGGCITGDLESNDATCRQISKAVGIKIVSVDYRLAPTHRFPAALDDCYAGAIWAMDNYGISTGTKIKIVIIGMSAGGGLAFGVALKILDNGFGDFLQGVIGLSPVTCHPNAVPPELQSQYTSYEENDSTTMNSKSAMMTTFDAYAAPPDDQYASPLLHKRLKDLPRVYLSCDGKDTLRDDSILMKKLLDDAKVPALLDLYPSYPHMHYSYPSKHLSKAFERFHQNLVNGVKFVIS